MTKSKLEKAEEYAEQCYGWCNNDQVTDVAIATYITSAEPREKRIEELEKKNAELQQQIVQLKKDVIENESDCAICGFQQENAELKDEVRKLKLLVSSLVWKINQIWI